MAKRGKIVAVSIGLVGVTVLVAAGFAAKGRIKEEWWRHRLIHGSEIERREAAAQLGKLGSVSAVPDLAAALRKACLESMARSQQNFAVTHPFAPSLAPDRPLLDERLHWAFYRALIEIGEPALPGLIHDLASREGDDELSSNFLAWTVFSIQYQKLLGPSDGMPPNFDDTASFTPVEVLRMIARDEHLTGEHRDVAARALKKLEVH